MRIRDILPVPDPYANIASLARDDTLPKRSRGL